MTQKTLPADGAGSSDAAASGSDAGATTTAAITILTAAPINDASETLAEGLPVDDYHGQGGEYELVDGVRRLVSRTDRTVRTKED